MKGNDIIEELYATELPVPFMSLWIEDCVKRAKDYNSGGLVTTRSMYSLLVWAL